LAAGFLIAAAILAGAGCRAKTNYFPEGNVQTGMASWYGGEFHGRLTSSREVYDMNDLTAAHKTLPMGTKVRVTNQANGKSEIVTINDRGPFIRDRIIDLTIGTAERLGFRQRGVAPVKVEVLSHGKARD
jgi:rare lipoprotein A